MASGGTLLRIIVSTVFWFTAFVQKFHSVFHIIGLSGILFIFSVAGGWVFRVVEFPIESKAIETILGLRVGVIRNLVTKITSTPQAIKSDMEGEVISYEIKYSSAIAGGTVVENGENDPLWTLEGSIYYCVTTYTLIGFGNLAPRTSLGRLIAIFYSGISIPVGTLVLGELGDLILRGLKFCYIMLRRLFGYSSASKKRAHPPPDDFTTNNNVDYDSTDLQQDHDLCCERLQPDRTYSFGGSMVDLEGSRVDLGGSTLDLEGSRVDLGGSTLDQEGSRVGLERSRVDLERSILDLEGSIIDLEDNRNDPNGGNVHFRTEALGLDNFPDDSDLSDTSSLWNECDERSLADALDELRLSEFNDFRLSSQNESYLCVNDEVGDLGVSYDETGESLLSSHGERYVFDLDDGETNYHDKGKPDIVDVVINLDREMNDVGADGLNLVRRRTRSHNSGHLVRGRKTSNPDCDGNVDSKSLHLSKWANSHQGENTTESEKSSFKDTCVKSKERSRRSGKGSPILPPLFVTLVLLASPFRMLFIGNILRKCLRRIMRALERSPDFAPSGREKKTGNVNTSRGSGCREKRLRTCDVCGASRVGLTRRDHTAAMSNVDNGHSNFKLNTTGFVPDGQGVCERSHQRGLVWSKLGIRPPAEVPSDDESAYSRRGGFPCRVLDRSGNNRGPRGGEEEYESSSARSRRGYPESDLTHTGGGGGDLDTSTGGGGGDLMTTTDPTSTTALTMTGDTTGDTTQASASTGKDDDDDDDDDDDGDEEESTPVLATIVVTCAYIVGGAIALAKNSKNLDILDSIWFLYISMVTIGYGDVFPHDEIVFVVMLPYIFIGLSLMSSVLNEVTNYFTNNINKARSIGQEVQQIIQVTRAVNEAIQQKQRAQARWDFVRRTVWKKNLPQTLADESRWFKSQIFAKERELIRRAYMIYFRRPPCPAVEQAEQTEGQPGELLGPMPPLPPTAAQESQGGGLLTKDTEQIIEEVLEVYLTLWQRIRKFLVRTFYHVRHFVTGAPVPPPTPPVTRTVTVKKTEPFFFA